MDKQVGQVELPDCTVRPRQKRKINIEYSNIQIFNPVAMLHEV
jgi:hypothetical protein